METIARKPKLTRAEKKALRNKGKDVPGFETHGKNNQMKLRSIQPKTDNQEKIFRAFTDGFNLVIHGVPGSGKSMVSLYLALKEIEEYKTFSKVVIIRSAVSSREQGFLPGNLKEKTKVFEMPYKNICNELYGRGDAYDILTNKKIIEFESTSYQRGLTFDNAVIILDEAQNMGAHELHTIITRVGDNSRLVICGDIGQNDLVFKRNDVSGLLETMKILKRMSSVQFVELGIDDIVRSKFVKEFIIAKENVKVPEQATISMIPKKTERV